MEAECGFEKDDEPGSKRRKVDECSKVVLDVGGTCFTTCISTLTSRFARDSWFGPRFSGIYADRLEGCIFIDGNPKYFPIVLAYLRDGWCSLPHNLFELRQLRQEAEFYSISGLLELVDHTPAMIEFFQKVMACSPEGDDLDKCQLKGNACEMLKLPGLYDTASVQERAAAYRVTRQMRQRLDAVIDSKMHGRRAPSVLRLHDTAGVVPGYAGIYRRCSGMVANSFPVWRHESGKHWLYTTTTGNWSVCKQKVDKSDDRVHFGLDKDFKSTMSFLRTGAEDEGGHNGGQPLQMSWMRYNRDIQNYEAFDTIRWTEELQDQ